MLSKMFKYLMLILGFVSAVNCESTQVIQTKSGPVQGEILKTVIDHVPYSAFKGIPYAEPPIGDLRFKPPVEKKAWTKVLKATVEGANCPQMDFVDEDRFTGSENCLYLNVYTPHTNFKQKPKTLRAVMVWIHGGWFVSGYGNSSLYGPDFIMEDANDIVLVTFNYRLGALGFLSLNNDDATGNAALKDQNMVLKWVQQNIDQFGGDPNNVTLSGQSAGGIAVDLHVLSDMSNGLFHRAISMSASPLNSWGYQSAEDAELQAFELGYRLGLPKTSENKRTLLSLLHKASPIQLVKIEMEITQELQERAPGNRPFRPTTEDPLVAQDEEKFLTDCPYSIYSKGKFAKMPYITGFVKDEAVRFSNNMAFIIKALNLAAFSINLIRTSSGFKEHVLNPSVADEESNEEIDEIVVPKTENGQLSAATDFYILGIDTKREYLQKNNDDQPIYYYRLSYDVKDSLHRLLYSINRDGVAQGDDIGYLFRTILVKQPLGGNDPTKILRRRIIKLWTNFVKYGNPTPHYKNEILGITWPESGSSGKLLDIKSDSVMTVENRPTSRLIKLVQQYKDLVPKNEEDCGASFL